MEATCASHFVQVGRAVMSEHGGGDVQPVASSREGPGAPESRAGRRPGVLLPSATMLGSLSLGWESL